jgi:DNA-directed RNA polymerase specialized sigma24 family protein
MALEVSDVRSILGDVVEALPFEERTVLTLLYWEGVTLREAADVLGLDHPFKVVRIRNRAFARIKGLTDE